MGENSLWEIFFLHKNGVRLSVKIEPVVPELAVELVKVQINAQRQGRSHNKHFQRKTRTVLRLSTLACETERYHYIQSRTPNRNGTCAF